MKQFTAQLINCFSGRFQNKIVTQFVINISTVSFYFLFTFSVMFLTFVILARTLSSAEFGEINLINNTSSYLLIFISFQFYNAMYKFLPELDAEDEFNTYAYTAFLANSFSIVLFAIISILIYSIGIKGLNISFLSWQMTIWYTIFTNLFLLFESFLRGKKLYKYISVTKFYTELGLLLLVVFTVYILKIREFWVYPLCYIISRNIFIISSLIKQKLVVCKIQWDIFKKIISYSSLILINTLFTCVITNSDIIILNYFHPGSGVGVYSAYQVIIKRFFVTLFFNVFAVVFIPTIAPLEKRAVLDKINKHLPVIFFGVLGSSFLVTVVQIILFGHQYTLDCIYALISASSVAFYIIFQLYNTVFNLDGITGLKVGLITLGVAIPLALVIQTYLTRHWKVTGAMIASLLTNLMLVLIFKLFIILKQKQSRFFKRKILES